VVEIDGYVFHKSRRQDENRRRDTKLQRSGIRVLRVTQPRIEFGPEELMADVRRRALTVISRPRCSGVSDAPAAAALDP
jgi:very-short-patch-repair endonuclease